MKKQKTIKAYRHGDICILSISKLPKGVRATKTDTLLQTGSSGNPHTFTGGVFYSKQDGDFVIGYLKAKNCKLYHAEHSPKGAKIADGIYEIRRQHEVTHEGMVAVVD